MPKLCSRFVIFCVMTAVVAWAQAPQPEQPEVPPADSQSRSAMPPSQSKEQAEEEELAPAALERDVSRFPPLIQELYNATRETKEQAILARLKTAEELLESGADVTAVDPEGRTPLHWAVFGSSYNTNPKVVVAYEEIADALIARGVDLNREDLYHDTALDYLLYSPNFEMQTLLIEHGATSGFFPAFFPVFNQRQPGMPERSLFAVATPKTDLQPGQTLSVRLSVPVDSDRSRTGDPIEGMVTYPLCKNGEQVVCNPGELIIPPGTRINGTILFAAKAPDKYSRPRLVLDFSNFVHQDGQQSPLYARVIDVDNARETIRNNEILGIVQPHASSKVSLAIAALSAANPIAGYTIRGVQTVYGLSIRREVHFPEGTDVQVQVVRASTLKEKDSWAGWPALPVTAELQRLVAAAPARTETANHKPSDFTNLMFIGSREELLAAFGEAGWFQADNLGVSAALKTAQATLRQSDYGKAPVSELRLQERPPDLVLQKSLDTFAKRHHIRIWKLSSQYDGRDVWVGAATHDIATSNSRAHTKWSHRIDPHVDRERDWVETDLLFIGTGIAYADIDRPDLPRKSSNATGDVMLTDGKMSVVLLAPAGTKSGAPPVLEARP